MKYGPLDNSPNAAKPLGGSSDPQLASRHNGISSREKERRGGRARKGDVNDCVLLFYRRGAGAVLTKVS